MIFRHYVGDPLQFPTHLPDYVGYIMFPLFRSEDIGHYSCR